jgi:hypothetical protein
VAVVVMPPVATNFLVAHYIAHDGATVFRVSNDFSKCHVRTSEKLLRLETFDPLPSARG